MSREGNIYLPWPGYGVFGGIGWASFSDYLGRTNTYLTFFLIQIVAFAALLYITGVIFFQDVLYTIITSYGGRFATFPAFIEDLFRAEETWCDPWV